jgi:hypothetical protein
MQVKKDEEVEARKKTDQEVNSARFAILIAKTMIMMMIYVFWDGTPYRLLL